MECCISGPTNCEGKLARTFRFPHDGNIFVIFSIMEYLWIDLHIKSYVALNRGVTFLALT